MTDDKILSTAQYKKTLSIAGFNAVNSALTAIQLEGGISKKKKGKKKVTLESRIEYWVAHFLKIHEDYYKRVVAKVTLYKPEESISKLMKATNIEELNTIWRLLSADERHDKAIIKVAQELKKKYV